MGRPPTIAARLARVEHHLFGSEFVPSSNGKVKRPSLLFITPAHQRHELTRLCLEQRVWACQQLSEHGVDASSVVVACDANLDAARDLGFYTVERDNKWLGRRWNDGHELAHREGFDYTFPIGSDSWIDPWVLMMLAGRPPVDTIIFTRWYSMIHATGERRLTVKIDSPFGVGFCIPTELMRGVGWRPCDERRPRGCDTSTLRTLTAIQDVRFSYHEYHPLEYVAFQSGKTQITSYDKLQRVYRGRQSGDPFAGLADVYPKHLVERAVAYYAQGRAAAA